MCRPQSVTCERCERVLPVGKRGRLPSTCRSCQRRVLRDRVATCKRCGKEFDAGTRGRFPAFCSQACSERVRRETQGPRPVRSRCESCGCDVVSTSRRKWCGPCGLRFRSAELFACKECGKHFKKTGGRTKLMFCSGECFHADRSRRAHEEREMLRSIDLVLSVIKRAGRTGSRIVRATERRFSTGHKTCGHCGAAFVHVGPKRFCSRRCQSKHHTIANGGRGTSSSHTTRAKRKGLPRIYTITRKKVAVRDGYVCQLCGQQTLMLWVDGDGRSPTVDHVVPLGHPRNLIHGHVWNNVQLACSDCNTRKGALLEHESLLIATNPREAVAAIRAGIGRMFLSDA